MTKHLGRDALSKSSARQWVKVWDGPTRLFHWSLVALVATSYVTARNGWIDWHFYAGYSILALVLFRILWGLFGSETARFAHFVRGPRAAIAHLRHLLRRDADEEAGHNAAGAAMVLALLGLLLFQAGSGLFATDGLFSEGPLASLVGPEWSERITGWHGLSFDLIMIAVALHVLAVVVYGLLLRHDLVRPMITGWKRLPTAIAAPRMVTPWLALGLLAVAVGGVAAIVTL